MQMLATITEKEKEKEKSIFVAAQTWPFGSWKIFMLKFGPQKYITGFETL